MTPVPLLSNLLSCTQEHNAIVKEVDAKLVAYAGVLNTLENLKVKQQTLAKQNGEAFARFTVRRRCHQ